MAEKDCLAVTLSRACKLLVHETMHLLGVGHCTYMDCCMNGSGHLQEDFRQSMFLCPIDLKKMLALFEFDLLERYEKLRAFYIKHNCVAELESVKNILSEISPNHEIENTVIAHEAFEANVISCPVCGTTVKNGTGLAIHQTRSKTCRLKRLTTGHPAMRELNVIVRKRGQHGAHDLYCWFYLLNKSIWSWSGLYSKELDFLTVF